MLPEHIGGAMKKENSLPGSMPSLFLNRKNFRSILSCWKKQRNHRKLGKELELFAFSEKVGMGLPLWLPKGATLRERLENFLKKAQVKAGYLPVVTPHLGSKELYITSGHYEKYGK